MKLSPAKGSKLNLNKSELLTFKSRKKRVFSGVSAILDFKIINFRQYDCSNEPESPNCQIVELFLTVDTSRKMQNGVNIDDSIDRCEFCECFLSFSNNILSGMIILKNDVIAILNEKVNSISARNGQSTFPVGPDKQYEVVDLSPQWLTIPCEITIFL